MARWAGWGAGPAGAGAAGGPSPLFLGLACAGALVVAAVLAWDGKVLGAIAAAGAAAYFGLRLTGKLGGKQ